MNVSLSREGGRTPCLSIMRFVQYILNVPESKRHYQAKSGLIRETPLQPLSYSGLALALAAPHCRS